MCKQKKLYRWAYFKTYNGIKIYCQTYYVWKETPCGYWIDIFRNNLTGHEPSWKNGQRWVSKTGKKRFAYPTKEQAAVAFRLRKKKYLRILKQRVKETELILTYFKDSSIDDFSIALNSGDFYANLRRSS